MDHIVGGVPLIPQTQRNSCWYACAHMMAGWYRFRYGRPPPNTPETAAWSGIRMLDAGMPWAQYRAFAESLGLRWFHQPEHPPTVADIAGWLQRFGPMIVDGAPLGPDGRPGSGGHAIVLRGISDEGPAPSIWINNPAPLNVGYQGRRPLSWLWQILSDARNPRRRVSFLHYPPGG